MIADPILAAAINEQVARHGSLRNAAAVLKTDHTYLWRLRNGVKNNPSEALLKRLRLTRTVTITYTKAKP